MTGALTLAPVSVSTLKCLLLCMLLYLLDCKRKS